MRTYALCSVIVIMSFFSGCAEKNEISVQEENEILEEADTNTESAESEEYIILTQEEFASYFHEIEITEENWSEYFEIVEAKEEDLDSFDEPTGEYAIVEAIQPKVELTMGDSYDDHEVVFRFHVTYRSDLPEELEEDIDVELDDYFADGFFNNNVGYCLIKPIEVYRKNGDEIALKEKNVIESIELSKVVGSVWIYEKPADDKWNTDIMGKKYLAVETEKGDRWAVYENGDWSYSLPTKDMDTDKYLNSLDLSDNKTGHGCTGIYYPFNILVLMK